MDFFKVTQISRISQIFESFGFGSHGFLNPLDSDLTDFWIRWIRILRIFESFGFGFYGL